MIANDMLLLTQKKSIELKGFADLHTHPAAHLGYGGPENGSGQGLFWGRPFNTTGEDIVKDIPACAADKHSGFTLDAVEDYTHRELVKALDSPSGFQHKPDGPLTCSSWPNALSVNHQQMHIDWIKRAWKGGLRLMVASAVDSQPLAMAWRNSLKGAVGGAVTMLAAAAGGPIGAAGAAVGTGMVIGAAVDTPAPDTDFDRVSAEHQLEAIQQMVALNSEWMQIVKTSNEAKSAIKAGKLAVVLGVEMDQLTAADMLQLWETHNVRFVTPIHLVNNSFGGAAVYNSTFNTANHWLNGSFFDVMEDAAIEFRFKAEQDAIKFILGNALPDNNESVYPSCAKSSSAPSTYSNGDTLAIAWKGTNTPGRLRWIRRSNSGWKKSFIDDGNERQSNHSPSIAFFNNRWYVAWTGTNTSHPYIHIMRSSNATGDTWGEHYKLDGSSGRPEAKSRCNPFLLSANGRLSLFWVGTNSPGKMRWTSTFDGTTWTQKAEINDGTTRQSNYAPTAAFFNNHYYVAWTGTNTAHPYIHLLKSTDSQGSAWGSHVKFDGNGRPEAKSSQGPMLLAANGKIHLIWTGTNKGKIRWTKSTNGTTWQDKIIIQDWRERHTSQAPSIVFHKNQYYLFWIGKKLSYINYLRSIDATASKWVHHNTNIGCPGHRNKVGLKSSQAILQLMKRGFIIDLSHMSQESTESVLKLAETYHYPLVSSHQDVRPATGITDSEREMTREHAVRLSKLGGLVGFGTGWDPDTNEPISDWISRYQDVQSIFKCPLPLGTDFNGMSPQMSKSEQPVHYPFAGFNNESFNQLEFGQRKFSFGNDGLATYGMLPDFINAVSSKHPDTQNQLMSSVQVFVNMWKKTEAAQNNI